MRCISSLCARIGLYQVKFAPHLMTILSVLQLLRREVVILHPNWETNVCSDRRPRLGGRGREQWRHSGAYVTPQLFELMIPLFPFHVLPSSSLCRLLSSPVPIQSQRHLISEISAKDRLQRDDDVAFSSIQRYSRLSDGKEDFILMCK